MARKKSLRERWKAPAGQRVIRGLSALVGAPITHDALAALTIQLAYSEEVAPAVDLRGANLQGLGDLRVALGGARLEGAILTGTACTKGELRGACFFEAIGDGVGFVAADLTGATFGKARLPGASFERASLREAHFDGADLRGASFIGADARGASFVEAVMSRVEAAGADLRSADLRRADLTDADLAGCLFDDATRLAGARLCRRGLDRALATHAALQGAVFVDDSDARVGG